MKKDLAGALHDVLNLIETGKPDAAARMLRTLLSLLGHPAPAFVVEGRERASRGKGRQR